MKDPKYKKVSKRLTQAEMEELQELSDALDAQGEVDLPSDWDDMTEGELADLLAGF